MLTILEEMLILMHSGDCPITMTGWPGIMKCSVYYIKIDLQEKKKIN